MGSCGFQPGALPGGGVIDIDASDGSGDASTCVGTGLVRVCFAPADALVLDTQNLDTDVSGTCTQILTQTDGREVCVLAATSISVIGVVTATGSRPLVLAASSSITVAITGVIDVSSTGTRTGAGANYDPTCQMATFRANGGEGDSGGGGGGAGGGFGSPGANGGLGDDNDNQPPSPHKGVPGLAGAQQPVPAVLRGGCPGGSGGGGANNTTSVGPPGGASGGAVYLIAGDAITLTGHVFASGEGGRARSGATGFMDGGAGGGSGGMIGLDAPTISITGIVAANGGGGSGGGDYDGGDPGAPGSTLQWNVPAGGGVGAPCCGAQGGGGAAGTSVPTGGGIDISGGGGGGGGAGVVWIDGTVITASPTISPPPTAH